MKSAITIHILLLFFLLSCSTVTDNYQKLNTLLFEEIKPQKKEIRPTIYCMNQVDQNIFFVKVGYHSTFTEKKIISYDDQKNVILENHSDQSKPLLNYKDLIPEEFFPGEEANVKTIGPLKKDTKYTWKLNHHMLDLSYKENMRKCHQEKIISQDKTFELHFGSRNDYSLNVYWIDYNYDETHRYLLESSLDGLSFNKLQNINQKKYRAIASAKNPQDQKEPYRFMHKISLPYKGKWHIRVKRIEADGSYEYRKKVIFID